MYLTLVVPDSLENQVVDFLNFSWHKRRPAIVTHLGVVEAARTKRLIANARMLHA